MARKKKDIPLVILESIEPFLKQSGENYETTDPKESLLKIIDCDNDSDFFFEVIDFEIKNGKTYLDIEFKPQNKNNTAKYKTSINSTQLNAQFKNWVSRLSDYDKIISIYDDPIVKQNAENFFQKFDIVDEDAAYVSFDLEQQLFLEDYLDGAKDKLTKLKKGKTKDEVLELDDLELEADEIKSVLTKESKKKIIKRLSIFWGKAQKTGLEIIKEILIKVTSEIVKRLMIGQ